MSLKVWDIKKYISLLMLILLSAFLFISNIYAEVIGLDETGIVGLDDDLELLNNDFRVFDIDFDGKYEYYYFNVDGYLMTNSEVGGYKVNDKGQRIVNNEVYEVNVAPAEGNMSQIDNLDYYYIRNAKLSFNENWYIDENLKAKVCISTPEITGVDKIIVNKVNDIMKNRGIELLKLYAKEEAYKAKTKKLIIDIEKYNKVGLHPLNFIIFNDNEFYFNFTTYITLENKDIHKRNIGLYINVSDNTCIIQNIEYQKLNNLTYNNEYEIKEKEVEKDEGYNARFIDIVNELKEEYIEALINYIDDADNILDEYDEKFYDDKEKEISTIKKYIKNIENIYNTYNKKAKNMVKDNTIDEETYKKLNIDLKDIYERYREVLDRNLQVNINSIKEMIVSEKQ